MIEVAPTSAVNPRPDDAAALIELGEDVVVVADALEHALDGEIEESLIFARPPMPHQQKATNARVPGVPDGPLIGPRLKQIGQTYFTCRHVSAPSPQGGHQDCQRAQCQTLSAVAARTWPGYWRRVSAARE